MHCQHLELPGGGHAIVCTAGRRRRAQLCQDCGARPHRFLCDAECGSGTCDWMLCARCAARVGPDRHLCRFHAREAERRAAELGG